MPQGGLNSHAAGLACTIFDAILSFGKPRINRDQVAPRDTDIVQPKVRLLTNKATLNDEMVRRLQESFLHEALDERLMHNRDNGVA
jgi:hypothetical protein